MYLLLSNALDIQFALCDISIMASLAGNMFQAVDASNRKVVNAGLVQF